MGVLLQFLGPCFAEKKVTFGCPMEHICFRDTVEFYEAVPLDTAIQLWNNTAHEGTLKALKNKIVSGISVLDRLRSERCDEQALLCLYFDQLITKKQLKERMSQIIGNDAVLGSFLEAVRRLKGEKSGLQVVRTNFCSVLFVLRCTVAWVIAMLIFRSVMTVADRATLHT